MKRFEAVFAGGTYEDMWNKIFLMYDYFEDLSIYVADKLGFPLDLEESRNVRTFMQKRYEGDMELGDGVKGPKLL